MEERQGIRKNSTTYGAMGQPFEPNYLMNPGLERAPLLSDPAYMNPAMAPSFYPPGGADSATLTAPAIVLDGSTAPPAEWAIIPGYEDMGTDNEGGRFLPPPDLGPIPGAVPVPADTNWAIPFISEDTARKALLDYAKSKCCYRTTPAEQMDFRELRPYNTYRYRLETFTESRTCKWMTKPHTGGAVDSPVFGSPPMPWDIPIQVPAMFKDDTKIMPVPHTSTVKPCAQCLGICRTVCKKCHGGGKVCCWVCNGTGRHFNDSCHHCRGCGTETCPSCHSSKYQRCEGCSGRGQILNYIQLTVTWKNNIYEFIVEHNSEFPTDLFRKVKGEKVFTDEQIQLPPLVNFPAPAINQASKNALQQHFSQFTSSSRILRQRHTVEWLPLTKVEYTWQGNPHDYFVYGKENKVYTDNYPQKCCCCCVVM